MGPGKTLPINNILQTNAKLVDLEPDTLYLISIWATTNAGQGEETFSEDRTNTLAGTFTVDIGAVKSISSANSR